MTNAIVCVICFCALWMWISGELKNAPIVDEDENIISEDEARGGN